MSPIQVLFIMSSLTAVSAGIPQMVKLVKTKTSDGFNLATWMMWIGTQSVSALYSFSIGDPLLMTINFCWISFYAIMTTLIIRYSPKRQAAEAHTTATAVTASLQPKVIEEAAGTA